MPNESLPGGLRPAAERRPAAALLHVARWRVLAVLVVFACGLVSFQGGVGLSTGIEPSTAGPLTRIYYVIGLFFLGGLDIGVPARGPTWAVSLAWFAF